MAKQNNQKSAQTPMEETLNKHEAFFLKYQKQIIAAVVALVVIIGGWSLYQTYVAGPKAVKANTALAKGQEYFANARFDQALMGDSTGFPGFVKLAAELGGDAGNLANLYAGLSYAQLNKWQEAANYIEKFDGCDDQMISPAATGALGNVYAHLNQLDKAVSLLKKAADAADNNSLSPTFLIQAGEILESQGKKDEALKLYQTIKDKYFNSMAYQTIDAYIERASAK
ncbi:MAG: tetratricopeptide repeat protein [Prevotella sp.]|nr:tetratricopeptide repeat protein [Prevotella sp.]